MKKRNSVKVPLRKDALVDLRDDNPRAVWLLAIPNYQKCVIPQSKTFNSYYFRENVAKEIRTSVYFDREKLQFVGLDDAVKKHMSEVYAGVDIDKELGKMAMWLTSAKGKSRTGTISFIMTWLSKAAPTLSQTDHLEFISSDTPLGRLYNEYRRELWKGREHILEFNTIRLRRSSAPP